MRKLKFKCWTGKKMLDVHSLDLDNHDGTLSGFHHTGSPFDKNSSAISLNENDGHKFIEYLGSDFKGVDIFTGDIRQFKNGVGFVIYDKHGIGVQSFGSEAIDYEKILVLQESIYLGNIFQVPEKMKEIWKVPEKL